VLRAGGVGVLTVAVVGVGGLSYRAYDNEVRDPAQGHAFDAWRQWREERGYPGLAAAAVLAASPHNTQPWLFRVHDDRIDLYADSARGLGTLDPFGREMHVGLGCALENLALAAAARGYDAHVAVRPDPADPLLVARVDLARGTARGSALYDAIGDRHTNRGPYRDSEVPAGILAALTALTGDAAPASVAWFTTADAKHRLSDLMVTAAEAIVADEQQSRDGFGCLRSSGDSIERHKDGLTLDGQGLNAPITAAAKLLPATSRTSGDRFWVAQTRTVHTRTAAAYGMILTPDPRDPAQRLAGGRLLQRIHLAVTARGLAMQHMNQITERIDRDRSLARPAQFEPALSALVAQPGRQTLATFRIGYPVRAGRRSPRRPAAEVIR